MSYVQFAKRYGLVTDFDVQGHIHAGLMAAHMPKSYHRRYQATLADLQEKRTAGVLLYREAIERGEVTEPKALTGLERIEFNANHGDPERPSTIAAKRVLEKRRKRAAELAK